MNRLMKGISGGAAILACTGSLVGCNAKPQFKDYQPSNVLRCMSIKSISYQDDFHRILAKVNVNYNDWSNRTECLKFMSILGDRDQVSFILSNINLTDFEIFARACDKSRNLIVDQIKMPMDSILNPSYANFILFSNNCDLRLINEQRRIGLDNKALNSLGFFIQKFSENSKEYQIGRSPVSREVYEGAILPYFGNKSQLISAIVGEFDKRPEQTAFFMGYKVGDRPQLFCGMANDFEIDDRETLIFNLNACLFDIN